MPPTDDPVETTDAAVVAAPTERQVSVRLPESLADKLEAAAEERDVSKSRLVARAVERYLAALPPIADVLP